MEEPALPETPALRALSELVAGAGRSERTALTRAWAASLEPPRSALHRQALAATLLDVCGRLHATLHGDQGAGACTRCAPDWPLIARFTDPSADPREVLGQWAAAYFAAFDRAHPVSAADQAATLMREAPARPWPLALLGHAVGESPPALRRAFRQRFGLTPVAYLHLLRARRAIALCRGVAKVEAVAAEVGYRSKKDLYATLDRWVGLTPGAVKRLTRDRRRLIECRLDSAIAAGMQKSAPATAQRRRRARRRSTASRPPMSAAPPTSATPA